MDGEAADANAEQPPAEMDAMEGMDGAMEAMDGMEGAMEGMEGMDAMDAMEAMDGGMEPEAASPSQIEDGGEAAGDVDGGPSAADFRNDESK